MVNYSNKNSFDIPPYFKFSTASSFLIFAIYISFLKLNNSSPSQQSHYFVSFMSYVYSDSDYI